MPVYKTKTPTKDGRCWFYKTNYTDVFGNHKQVVSKKFATKTEAKMEEAKFLNEVNDCGSTPIDMTFGELYKKFLDFQEDKVRDTTKRNYANKAKFIEPFFNVSCKDYTIEMFEEWKKNINSNTNICTTFKNDILKFWKSILNYGMNWYSLDFISVYRRMTNFTNPNELKKEMEFYTYDEFKAFLNEESDLKFRCLWQTLYYCGLRCGEARGLTWDSIDWTNKRLTVSKQVQNVNGSKTKYYIAQPKTRDSHRTIPICDKLYDDLKAYYIKVSKPRNFNESWFVFGDNKGIEPFRPESVRTRCKNVSDKANLKQIRLHDFRHSCASLLINSGASVTMVAKYLGHTKIDVTLNTYSHMFQSALDGVLNIINDLNTASKSNEN